MIPTEKVSSFVIDHTKLKSGVYLAREGKGFRTFDVRVTAPNVEPAMDPSSAHSLEHLLATWFRNSSIQDDVIAFDGMMCLTGFYLILTDSHDEHEVRQLLIDALAWVMEQTEVPATEPATCGNYLLHNLDMAKYFARQYRERLIHDFQCTYVRLQVKTKDGMVFQDS